MVDGYRLNMLGESTNSVIASYDAETEVIALMTRKAAIGQSMHSDFCRLGGKTINGWLANPAQIPAFLHMLERQQWIKHGEPAQNSRFWQLLQGPRAKMFGVFSPYEMQVIHDWIVGDNTNAQRVPAARRMPQLSAVDANGSDPLDGLGQEDGKTGFDDDLAMLKRQFAVPGDRDGLMQLLARLMAPCSHFTPAGLLATRLYGRLLHSA
jgi:hypothetical protein